VALQHRGQDAAGIVTASTADSWESTRFSTHKDVGSVRDVFQQRHVSELLGNVGIAHCRYPTAGGSSCREAQPLYVNYPCGLALAHNGNLTNAASEREKVVRSLRHLNATSDSEVLLNIFAEELQTAFSHAGKGGKGSVKGGSGDAGAGEPSSNLDRERFPEEAIFAAVRATMLRCRGGYAVALLIHNVGVVCFRDPWGIRPLCLGQRASSTMPGGVDYLAGSESTALDLLGFELLGDVAPGEAVLMLPMVLDCPRANKGLYRKLCHSAPVLSPCLFEFVYFARPDSIMDGVCVYEARLRMGERLAEKIRRLYGEDHGIDVVIPVPDTSRTSALQLASTLKCLYRDGFQKNHYVGRTFIMPGQVKRRKSVRMKLSVVKAEFEGRRVLLVDDSIVRGTTTRELIQMAKQAGARDVCVASAAPEVRHPNVYGIDIPTQAELVAWGRDPAGVAEELGARWVVFQDLADLEAAVQAMNPELHTFESSVFSGKYVTGDVSSEYLERLKGQRVS
jgi:amidophosphoribosyltransferase